MGTGSRVVSAALLGGGFALCALLGGWLSRAGWRQRLGLVRGQSDGAGIAVGCCGILALSYGAARGLEALGAGADPTWRETSATLAGAAGGEALGLFLAVAVIAPWGEELFFRGLLQRGLVPHLGRGSAIVASAGLFALCHGGWPLRTGSFVLGVALGYLVDRCGSLWPALAAHAANNTAVVLVAWLGVAPSRWLSPPLPPGSAAGLEALLAASCGVLALAWSGRRATRCLEDST